jgi:TRAP-type mannitol/chloroaromatic compound transport system substrate-binding protein
MMAHDIFISCSSQDKPIADAACATLEAAGIRCWIAPRDIQPGADWAESIIGAIDGCRVMVLIFSSHANDSKQVRREVQRAFDREVPVVPVRIDKVAPSNTLAYYMGPVHWLDALTPPLERHLASLTVTVKSILGSQRPEPAAAAATIPAASDPIPSPPLTPQEPVQREQPGVVVAPRSQPQPDAAPPTTAPAGRRPLAIAAVLGAAALVGIGAFLIIPRAPTTPVETKTTTPVAKPPITPVVTVPDPPPPLPEVKWRLASALTASTKTKVGDFSQRVATTTGGRFTVNVFHAGEIVPAYETVNVVSSGTIEAGYVPGYYFAHRDPVFQFLSGAPFGLEPQQHLAWRRRADVKAAFERALAKHQIVALPCGVFGRIEEFWSLKVIRSVADLRGFKLRIGGWFAQSYAKLQAVPQLLSGGEIRAALDRGTIDGAQWLTPRSAGDLGFNRAAPYYYYPGVSMPTVVVDLIVNRAKWTELPADYRAAVETACKESADAMLADEKTEDGKALDKFRAAGSRIDPLPLAIQRQLYDAARDAQTEAVATSSEARELLRLFDSVSKDTVGAKLP